MKNIPLLSICIPTYNREPYLKQTLQSIADSPEFGHNVEVVISDNFSTDSTENTCMEYAQKYPNIKYFRQPSPTTPADANFIDALSLASGYYIKLHNDNIFLNRNTLAFMLETIRLNLNTGNHIFFCNNYKNNIDLSVYCKRPDTLLNSISFQSTSIAFFGCWKDDFSKLQDKKRCIGLQLMQVDWVYRMIADKTAVINFCGLYTFPPLKKKSGGYNIFKIFSYNYLGILKEFVEKKQISKTAYNTEKRRLLFGFLMPTYASLVYRPKSFNFSKDKKFTYLKDYKKEWYFYFAVLLIIPYLIFYGLMLLLRRFTAKNRRISDFLRKTKRNILIFFSKLENKIFK